MRKIGEGEGRRKGRGRDLRFTRVILKDERGRVGERGEQEIQDLLEQF